MRQANILLATYIAHHYTSVGILSFSLNPGATETRLRRYTDTSWWAWIVEWLSFPPHMGAINQLYAATSQELTRMDSGKYFIPWARAAKPRNGCQDVALADRLWEFLEQETTGKY